MMQVAQMIAGEISGKQNCLMGPHEPKKTQIK
jgi:hypothetical protein